MQTGSENRIGSDRGAEGGVSEYWQKEGQIHHGIQFVRLLRGGPSDVVHDAAHKLIVASGLP